MNFTLPGFQLRVAARIRYQGDVTTTVVGVVDTSVGLLRSDKGVYGKRHIVWIRSIPANGGTVIPLNEVVATMIGLLMVGGTDSNELYALACEGFGRTLAETTTGAVDEEQGGPGAGVVRGILHAPKELELAVAGDE
jgi:hypothetical protein